MVASPAERSGGSGGGLRLLSLGFVGGLDLMRVDTRWRRLRVLEQDMEMGENHGEIEVTIFVRVVDETCLSSDKNREKKPQLDKAARVEMSLHFLFLLLLF